MAAADAAKVSPHALAPGGIGRRAIGARTSGEASSLRRDARRRNLNFFEFERNFSYFPSFAEPPDDLT